MPYDIFLKNALLWIKEWHNSGVVPRKKAWYSHYDIFIPLSLVILFQFSKICNKFRRIRRIWRLEPGCQHCSQHARLFPLLKGKNDCSIRHISYDSSLNDHPKFFNYCLFLICLRSDWGTPKNAHFLSYRGFFATAPHTCLYWVVTCPEDAYSHVLKRFKMS